MKNFIRNSVYVLSILLNMAIEQNVWAGQVIRDDYIVATVNDKVVTRLGLEKRLALLSFISGIVSQSSKQDALSMLIDEHIIRAEAQKYNIKLSQAEVDRVFSNLAQRNGVSVKEFEAILGRSGINFSEFIRYTETQLLLGELIKVAVVPAIHVNESEINEKLGEMQYKRLSFGGKKEENISLESIREELYFTKVQSYFQDYLDNVRSGYLVEVKENVHLK